MVATHLKKVGTGPSLSWSSIPASFNNNHIYTFGILLCKAHLEKDVFMGAYAFVKPGYLSALMMPFQMCRLPNPSHKRCRLLNWVLITCRRISHFNLSDHRTFCSQTVYMSFVWEKIVTFLNSFFFGWKSFNFIFSWHYNLCYVQFWGHAVKSITRSCLFLKQYWLRAWR